VTSLPTSARLRGVRQRRYLIQPRTFIQKIVDDRRQRARHRADPRARRENRRARESTRETAFIMDAIAAGCHTLGTAGRKVRQAGPARLAGKTGTTNDFVDGLVLRLPARDGRRIAWGASTSPRTRQEPEGPVASPCRCWIEILGQVLKGVPEGQRSVPAGSDRRAAACRSGRARPRPREDRGTSIASSQARQGKTRKRSAERAA